MIEETNNRKDAEFPLKPEHQVFSDSEYQKLIMIACDIPGGATKEQIFLFVRKCEEMRLQELMLDSILERVVVVAGYTENDFLVRPPAARKEGV